MFQMSLFYLKMQHVMQHKFVTANDFFPVNCYTLFNVSTISQKQSKKRWRAEKNDLLTRIYKQSWTLVDIVTLIYSRCRLRSWLTCWSYCNFNNGKITKMTQWHGRMCWATRSHENDKRMPDVYLHTTLTYLDWNEAWRINNEK